MKSTKTRLFGCCLSALLLVVGCTVPQQYWPQRDIVGSDAGTIPGKRTVLIASRSSEYKQQLVTELQQQLSAAQISHQTIGVGRLHEVDLADYAAVVVINTCLAWGLDSDIDAFLERQATTGNLILLTTSGSGRWLPDTRGYDYDAISGASVKANIGDVARNIVEKIQRKLYPT